MAALEILCSVIVIFFLIYYYFVESFKFWKQRGVVGPEPSFLFGNFKDSTLGKISTGIAIKDYYDIYEEKMIGVYIRSRPALILRDPDLIKDVLIKDFTAFANRGINQNTKVDPLSQNLVFIDGEEWRPLRRKLTPFFTSGKLKQMFYLLLPCGDVFEKYLSRLSENNEPIDCQNLTAKFTTEVIGTCAFGLKTDSISNENNEFHRMVKRTFSSSLKATIQKLMRESLPWLYNILGIYLVDRESIDFFTKCLKDTIDYRKQNNIVMHDFVDLLIEVKENSEKCNDIEITDTFLTAQAFAFFAAGSGTSSTAMSNVLYELALNQNIQDKLRQEIKREMKKTNGELTYEGVKNMKYLHMVLQETLRKYPLGTSLTRESCQPYTFHGTNITIPKKVKILIPVFALHRDPKIYPLPDIFDPERFTEEAIAARHRMHYIPFGDGPRNCIGARFSIYQIKVGLIKILLNHKADICGKTDIPYEFNSTAVILSPKNGIFLKFSRLSDK